mmetsp:Transcript_13255/g.28043  ORF Transcript_13255/g.28043 Transcript_13255/m.28043 type:complete len:298 (-) Transcript_13255:478-1371(-)
MLWLLALLWTGSSTYIFTIFVFVPTILYLARTWGVLTFGKILRVKMTLLEGTRRIEDWEVKQLDRFTEMGFALRPIKPQKQRTTREEELLTWFKRPLTCFRHPVKSVYVCVDNFRLFKYRYQTLNLIKIKVIANPFQKEMDVWDKFMAEIEATAIKKDTLKELRTWEHKFLMTSPTDAFGMLEYRVMRVGALRAAVKAVKAVAMAHRSYKVPLGAFEKKVKALEPSIGTVGTHDIDLLKDELRGICPDISDDESERFEAAMHELCMEIATALQVALNICHADRVKEKERQEKSRVAR